MDQNIVFIYVAIGVLFALFLLFKLALSLFRIRESGYQTVMRRKFRIADYCFIGFILITELYPIFRLGEIQLYHLVKSFLLVRWRQWLNTFGKR